MSILNEKVEVAIKIGMQAISNCASIKQLLHEVKPIIFSSNGQLGEISSMLKTATTSDEKKSIGQAVNQIKTALEVAIEQKLSELNIQAIEEKMQSFEIDGTAINEKQPAGSLHPITIVTNQVVSFFKKYGCEVNFGQEIETQWYNFDALNISEHHPARQMQDTFYLEGKEDNGKNYILRTHTTCVDIKTMTRKANQEFRSVSFGKTFRRDSDRTHTPMFHQIEFLEIGKEVNLRHLKAILISFLKDFFEQDDVGIRLRPSYFPFTSPSFEVDIKCNFLDNKVEINPNGTKFVEILGCGVLHRKVMERTGFDPKTYVGIAAGIGVERLAMLKYGYNDIREFYNGDLVFLEDASFNPALF